MLVMHTSKDRPVRVTRGFSSKENVPFKRKRRGRGGMEGWAIFWDAKEHTPYVIYYLTRYEMGFMQRKGWKIISQGCSTSSGMPVRKSLKDSLTE